MFNVLFLGAGKRVSLLEYLMRDFRRISEDVVNFYSVEFSDIVPIRNLAKIFKGASFDEPSCEKFVIDLVKDNHINIVIPCMDSGVRLLMKISKELKKYNCMALASNVEIDLSNKIEAPIGCDKFGINYPKTIISNDYNLPVLIKPKYGYGARGQEKLTKRKQVEKYIGSSDYILQEYISGKDEYTVDCYVSKGKSICAIPRLRIETSNGEVVNTKVVKNDRISNYAKYILSKFDFFGPITIQMFDDETPIVFDINMRFGGGVFWYCPLKKRP
jgi:carbamoyl-phosphate synthase large subunit